MKLVINKCFGGFGISKECAEYMASKGHKQAQKELERVGEWHGYGYVEGFDDGYDRADPLLIKAVEVLGQKADGNHARLQVVEIPKNIKYYIDNYDGMETVREQHRSW